jgi:DNA-binding IclR family transcriptional regulator
MPCGASCSIGTSVSINQTAAGKAWGALIDLIDLVIGKG